MVAKNGQPFPNAQALKANPPQLMFACGNGPPRATREEAREASLQAQARYAESLIPEIQAWGEKHRAKEKRKMQARQDGVRFIIPDGRMSKIFLRLGIGEKNSDVQQVQSPRIAPPHLASSALPTCKKCGAARPPFASSPKTTSAKHDQSGPVTKEIPKVVKVASYEDASTQTQNQDDSDNTSIDIIQASLYNADDKTSPQFLNRQSPPRDNASIPQTHVEDEADKLLMSASHTLVPDTDQTCDTSFRMPSDKEKVAADSTTIVNDSSILSEKDGAASIDLSVGNILDFCPILIFEGHIMGTEGTTTCKSCEEFGNITFAPDHFEVEDLSWITSVADGNDSPDPDDMKSLIKLILRSAPDCKQLRLLVALFDNLNIIFQRGFLACSELDRSKRERRGLSILLTNTEKNFERIYNKGQDTTLKLLQKNETLRFQVDGLKAKNEGLKGEKEEFEKNEEWMVEHIGELLDKIIIDEKENAALREKIEILQQPDEHLQEFLQSIKDDLDAMEGLRAGKSQLQQEKTQLQQEIERLQLEQSQLQQKVDEKNQDIESLRQRLAEEYLKTRDLDLVRKRLVKERNMGDLLMENLITVYRLFDTLGDVLRSPRSYEFSFEEIFSE